MDQGMTIRQAASTSGAGEAAIRRAVKAGRLKHSIEDGVYRIQAGDLAEYFRQYGRTRKGKAPGNVILSRPDLPAGRHGNDTLITELRERIRHLEGEVEYFRGLVDTLTRKSLPSPRDARGAYLRLKEWLLGSGKGKE